MFKRHTLFVIGAGASHEVGLPIGTGLAEAISDRLNVKFGEYPSEKIVSGDGEFFYHLWGPKRENGNELLEACWLIRDGLKLSHSIDDFLDIHSKNSYAQRVGKAALVRAVLMAERSSALYVSPNKQTYEFGRAAGTWYVKFFQVLCQGIPKEAWKNACDTVSFIIFNYDRCFEHVLAHGLQQVYGIRLQDTAGFLESVRVIHPYGTVGELDVMQNGRGVRFGGSGEQRVIENYSQLAEKIRTYTEQISDQSMLDQIQSELDHASCIVFLGFAFNEPNMNLLRPKSPLRGKTLYGTAFGMSDADVEVVREQLNEFFPDPVQPSERTFDHIYIENKLKCAGLFDYYAKSLAG